MKKGMLSKFYAKRVSTSPYFDPTFFTSENQAINAIEGVEMLPLDSNELADILITNTHTNFDKLSQKQLEKCKLVIHPNSGYDNFSVDFVKGSSFPIIIGNPIRSHAVVNFILSALFSHYCPLPTESVWSKTRVWKRKLLSELNVLLLGEGHIGTLLKQSLSPLVKELRIYDPYKGHNNLSLADIDVLIPVCSLNVLNRGMINRELLLKLNPDFLLINAARGDLVKTDELLAVLKERPRTQAIIDVFEKEPEDFGRFSSLSNLRPSSHLAGVYTNIDVKTVTFEEEVIADFIALTQPDFEKKYEKMLLKNRLHENEFLI